MKLETFFEKFDQFADAPDAVAKMRELVRHLAVAGKLVAQDLGDESSDLLLKKINAERLAAVKARQISPMKPLPEVGKGEQLFELQPGWAAARLIELVMEIQTGPFGSSLHKGDYQLGGSPVINPASLKDGKIVPLAEMAVGPATLKRLEVFKLRAGDIVMARRGEMGRCAIVTKDEGGWLCGTGSLVLRMPRSLHAPYLALVIGAPTARTYLRGASVGTTMQNLNQSILAKMPVGVPPLAEQKRIVAKVDELMALCDRLEAQQRERETRHASLARASLARFADAPTPANLTFLFHPSYAIPPADLRKSILTLAVQGKLVRQDPNDEPADSILRTTYSLFDRLVAAKQLSSPKPLPPIDDNELPFSLPIGWAWCRFGQIMRISSGDGLVAKDMNAGPIPVYGGNGVSGYHDAHNVTKRTLVIGRVGFYCGSIHVTPERAWVTDNAFITTFDEEHADINFLSWLLKATDLRERDNATAQPVISGGKVYPTVLALPPLAEQRRIVAKVEQLMALVDELETQLAASRATAANLLSALVTELTSSTRDRKVSAPSVSGAVRRSRPKESQHEITQTTP